MMKIKAIILAVIVILCFSCKKDSITNHSENIIGKWKAVSGTPPENFEPCDFSETLIFYKDKTFHEFYACDNLFSTGIWKIQDNILTISNNDFPVPMDITIISLSNSELTISFMGETVKYSKMATKPPSTNGLVAYYPFNGNANDGSGNQLNGTVYGASLTTDRNGVANKAYYFSGLGDYIKILSNTLLNIQNYTITAWVNVEEFGGSSAEAGYILSKGIYPNYNYLFGARISDQFATSTTNNNTFLGFASTSTFNTDSWYLLTVINDGTSLRLFVNGIANGSIALGPSQTNSNDIYIGRYEGTDSWNFKGKIDDIRIYNRALNIDEVTSIFDEK